MSRFVVVFVCFFVCGCFVVVVFFVCFFGFLEGGLRVYIIYYNKIYTALNNFLLTTIILLHKQNFN